nr:MAG TPA: hypothetical protein [Caudoviricetes sp.]
MLFDYTLELRSFFRCMTGVKSYISLGILFIVEVRRFRI